MEYNKLVRDNIPAIIEAKGETPVTHIAEQTEYRDKLFEKLLEEAREVAEDRNPEEVADLLEVIDAICIEMGFDRSEIEQIKERKRAERGGFERRIILDQA